MTLIKSFSLARKYPINQKRIYLHLIARLNITNVMDYCALLILEESYSQKKNILFYQGYTL